MIVPFIVPGDYRLSGDDLAAIREAVYAAREAVKAGDWKAAAGPMESALALIERCQWHVDGIAVPEAAVEQLVAAAPNRRADIADAIVATLTGLAEKAPGVGGYVDRTAQRRESGESLGEDARRARSRYAADEAEFVACTYRRVRPQFPEGRKGDVDARGAVSQAMTSEYGAAYSDRHIRRILASDGDVSRSEVA